MWIGVRAEARLLWPELGGAQSAIAARSVEFQFVRTFAGAAVRGSRKRGELHD